MPRLVQSIVLVFALAGLSAVAIHGNPQPSEPKVSRDWKRVRSESFVVAGNTGQGELSRAVTEIEAFRRTLKAVYPSMALSTDVPTVVVAFKDDASFNRFRPRDEKGRIRKYVGGYFMATPDVVYMVLPNSENREVTYRVVFHEYAHFVFHHNLRGLPQWLDEGLADFYSTFEGNYREGQSLVGKYVEERVRTLRSQSILFPLQQLMTAEGAYNLTKNPNTVGMFYAQSWALVHYLQVGHGGKRPGQLTAYLRALQSGRSVDEAFSSAFGTTFEGMQRELYEYVQRRSFAAALINAESSGGVSSEVEPMTEADARYLQGDLLVRLGDTDEAEKELTKALAVDADHLDARVARARMWIREDKSAEAIGALKALASANPSHFPSHYYLALALMGDEQYDEAIAASTRAVKLNPKSAAAWFDLSVSAMALSRTAQADASLTQAMTLDANPAWLRGRAYHAYALGQHATVVKDAAAYLAAAGTGSESAPYVAFAAAFSLRRLGKPDEATRVLDDVRGGIMAGSWTERVMSFMRGEVRAEQLLSSAKTNGELTEAHAYIGIASLIAGNTGDALPHLRWVKDRGSKNFVEYRMAVAELTRLERAAK
jgi:tetratricopeptide (TPR) repeat protein